MLPPDHARYVTPFSVEGRVNALADILTIIEQDPTVTIVRSSDDAVHATYTSTWFGFIDDLYFELSEDGTRLHVYSASRSGYYDFGVNRRRVEHLRAQWIYSSPTNT